MNHVLKNRLALAASALLVLLTACQKKADCLPKPVTADETGPAERSTTSTTGIPTPTLYVGRILGSSSTDYYVITASRRIFALDGVTYGPAPAFAITYASGDRYYGVGAYNGHSGTVRKVDGNPDIYFNYNNGSTDYPSNLCLGYTDGPAFLPDEIEMTDNNASSVYALQGNSLYRINDILLYGAYAQAILTFPAGWATYRKTICHGENSTSLKLFVAETAAPKGSSVSNLKVYTISNLTSTPSLPLVPEATVNISYTNTMNLSSFSTRTSGSISDWYHVTIGDATTNTSVTYRLSGTTVIAGGSAYYSVSSFPAFVNDCSFLP